MAFEEGEALDVHPVDGFDVLSIVELDPEQLSAQGALVLLVVVLQSVVLFNRMYLVFTSFPGASASHAPWDGDEFTTDEALLTPDLLV